MSIEDPRVFNEPWCLECEANSPRSCKCGETGEYTFDTTVDPAQKDLPF